MIASELFFDKIQQQYNNQLPFVAYRKPQSLDLKGIFQTNDTVYKVKNYKESGFVFAPFDDSESSILIPLEQQTEAPFEPVNPDKFARDLADGVNTVINNKELRKKMEKNGSLLLGRNTIQMNS